MSPGVSAVGEFGLIFYDAGGDLLTDTGSSLEGRCGPLQFAAINLRRFRLCVLLDMGASVR